MLTAHKRSLQFDMLNPLIASRWRQLYHKYVSHFENEQVNCPQTQTPTIMTTTTPMTNCNHIGSIWHSQMSQKGREKKRLRKEKGKAKKVSKAVSNDERHLNPKRKGSSLSK